MAARIHELQAQLKAKVAEANAALNAAQAKAKAENRALTEDETKVQDAFDASIAALKADIALEEKKLDRERAVGTSAREVPVESRVTRVERRAEADPAKGFTTHREFCLAVIENAGVRDKADVTDERLQGLAVADSGDKKAGGELAFMLPVAFTPRSVRATVGSDEQGNYADAYGGYAGNRSTLLPGMLERGFEGDPTAGLTQAIPMETPSVELLARVDSNHSSSVSGGFTVARKAETAAATASRMEMQKITLKAASLFGLAYATEDVLTDSPSSFAAIIDQGFRTEFGAALLNEKINGLGGDQFTGALVSDCLVTVDKETDQDADTILFENVTKMRSRSWGYGRAVWLANHDTYPQLAGMSVGLGTGGVLVYQTSVVGDRPDMLLGRPIYYTEFASTLGDVGDIILGNWSQFLEGVYQPLQSAESMHVRFVNHERAFKFWLRNAGAPWWNAALTPKRSTATLSPFVTLAARA